MIDCSKIKAGDEVQITNGDWFTADKVHRNYLGDVMVYISENVSRFPISTHLITDHRPAEHIVPKGEGCVDWDEPVWHLNQEGDIEQINDTRCTQWFCEIAQGNVSNNLQHLECKRERSAIKQELLECDGAVYEPVLSNLYCGIDRYAFVDKACLKGEAYKDFIVCFINKETAEAALEKVGAERIRKAWGG